jgi:DNA-binding beta-propeller fold protein YncE
MTNISPMKPTVRFASLCLPVLLILSANAAFAQAPAGPYKVLKTTQTMGTGGIDYVYAENEGRKLYVPRGGQTLVFNLDTLEAAGTIAGVGGHGVAVDPKSHHGFNSSKPVAMWDTQTLQKIKDIDVQGGPDGILFEPLTERVYVFSHSAPNVTVIDPKDGSIVGTIDLEGQPEQAASDGKGRMYVDLEDKANIAVVDVKTMKVLAHYPLGEKGNQPAGLGLDIKNHILFAMCHSQNCVVLNADDGKILTTLPIGNGTDGGGFNQATMEAFSSQRDGTLTIIKEKSPTEFEVLQNVETKQGGKTCTLDTKNNHIVVITVERTPAPDAAATPATTPATTNAAAGGQPGAPRRGGRGGGGGPGMLDVIVVGK